MIISEVEISVVMSVYKEKEEWLNLSIQSILDQTYRQFEFIIINDNPDSPEIGKILEYFAAKDPRIKLINNKYNLGLTESLNIGLSVAQGNYIARMDADDIAMENRFEMQLNFLEENAEYIACGSNVFAIRNSEKTSELVTKPLTNDEIQAYSFYESPIIHPTLFFKSSSIRYNTELIYSQDYDFICKLAECGKVFNFDKPLLYYRYTSSQISATKLLEQNRFAQNTRDLVIYKYLSKTYRLSTGVATSPFFVRRLLRQNTHDARNLSAILYSILFYKNQKSPQRVIAILSAVFFLEIDIKYKKRLVASLIMDFKDQQF